MDDKTHQEDSKDESALSRQTRGGSSSKRSSNLSKFEVKLPSDQNSGKGLHSQDTNNFEQMASQALPSEPINDIKKRQTTAPSTDKKKSSKQHTIVSTPDIRKSKGPLRLKTYSHNKPKPG